MSGDDRLIGEVSVDQVKKWTDLEWREFQFTHMVATNKRLSQLEHRASWRNALTSIPWAIVGAFIVAMTK